MPVVREISSQLILDSIHQFFFQQSFLDQYARWLVILLFVIVIIGSGGTNLSIVTLHYSRRLT